MSNPTIGRIVCPICEGDAEVRRYNGSERGKLYWACECGQIRPALAPGQAYVLANMRPLDAAQEKEPRAAGLEKPARVDAVKAETAAPSPQPAAPAKRSGLAAFLADL